MNLALFAFGVILLEVLSITATDIFVPFAGPMMSEIGTSTLRSGDLVGFAIIGEGLGALFWGSVFDRYGVRRTLIPGCLLFLASNLTLTLCVDPVVFGAARFFQGCARSLVFTAGYTTLRANMGERPYVSLVNLMTVMVVLVPALSVYAGVIVSRSGFQDWRLISWGITAVSLAIFAVFFWILPKEKARDVPRRPFRESLITSWRFFKGSIWTCASYALFNIPSIAWVGFLSMLYENNTSHINPESAPGGDVPFNLSGGFFSHSLSAFGQQVLNFPKHIFHSARTLWTQSTADLSPKDLEQITLGSNLFVVIAVTLCSLCFALISSIKRLRLSALRESSILLLVGGFLSFWLIPGTVGYGDPGCLVYFLFPYLLICILEDPVVSLYEASVLLDEDQGSAYGMRMALATVFADAVASLYLHFDDYFISKGSNHMAWLYSAIGILLFISYRMSLREQRLFAAGQAPAATASN